MADMPSGERLKKEQSDEVSSSESTSNVEEPSSTSAVRLTANMSGNTATDSSTKPFVLNPARLFNPFLKIDEEEVESKQSSVSEHGESVQTKEEEPEKQNVSFVPLGGANANQAAGTLARTSTGAATPTSSRGGPAATEGGASSIPFVFGQNLHERVEVPKSPESTSLETMNNGEEAKQNGTTTEMLFTEAVKNESSEKLLDGNGKSLSEAAREYEEKRAVKRKYQEVTVITGEEQENNVLQLNCKLYWFENSSWEERGRGSLRVNDLPDSCGSRLIVRAAGSHRLLLNTKIWSGMSVERASPKSLRITGMDSSGIVRIFLVTATSKEIDQLQKCLDWRVNNMKKLESEHQSLQATTELKKSKSFESKSEFSES